MRITMTKFKHSAFIRKNTPELRRRLGEIGYVLDETISEDEGYGYPILEINSPALGEGIVSGAELWFLTEYPCIYKDYIDCGKNKELFLAIAAITDEHDKDQWFIVKDNNEFILHKCTLKSADIYFCNADVMYKKATPDELIKHFVR